eukprot:COSAG05_NODE_396_length_10336_cov_233.199863_5_plen_149_part_00
MSDEGNERQRNKRDQQPKSTTKSTPPTRTCVTPNQFHGGPRTRSSAPVRFIGTSRRLCGHENSGRGCAPCEQQEMASSKSGLISPRCATRGRVARGSSSGTRPIPRGPADPPPPIFGHTSYASSGTAPSGSTVLTIQFAVEEMRKKLF